MKNGEYSEEKSQKNRPLTEKLQKEQEGEAVIESRDRKEESNNSPEIPDRR